MRSPYTMRISMGSGAHGLPSCASATAGNSQPPSVELCCRTTLSGISILAVCDEPDYAPGHQRTARFFRRILSFRSLPEGRLSSVRTDWRDVHALRMADLADNLRSAV